MLRDQLRGGRDRWDDEEVDRRADKNGTPEDAENQNHQGPGQSPNEVDKKRFQFGEHLAASLKRLRDAIRHLTQRRGLSPPQDRDHDQTQDDDESGSQRVQENNEEY
jgi:hypothetical protein